MTSSGFPAARPSWWISAGVMATNPTPRGGPSRCGDCVPPGHLPCGPPAACPRPAVDCASRSRGVPITTEEVSMLRFPKSVLAILATLALCLGGSRSLRAQVLSPNLIYTAVQPCRVFDTRFGASGRMLHGVTQTFNVVGGNTTATTFTGQGGKDGCCGLPGFGNGGLSPQVQAVVLNFVAVGSDAAGDLLAWPSDQAQPLASVLHYAGSARL